MKRIVATAVLCIVALSGCGETTEISVESEVFSGLDPVVVSEVFANTVAQQRIAEEPPETRESMAQGITRNFIVCRDAYRAYDDWIHTGTAPELEPLPIPTSPREPSSSDWTKSYQSLQDRVSSGEVQQLREWLTATGSCGQWIPATPGDVSGPTISDAIEAGE